MTGRAGSSDDVPRTGLFPALLKHWRNRRGLSQLDLAITRRATRARFLGYRGWLTGVGS